MWVFLYNLMQLSCSLETSHPSLDVVLVRVLLLFNQEAEKCPGFFCFFLNVPSIVPCCLPENSVQLSRWDTLVLMVCTCWLATRMAGSWLGCKIIAQTLFIDRNLTANQGAALSPRFHCAFPIEKNSGYNGYYYGHCVPSRWTLGRSWSWTSYINVCS